MKKPKKNKIIEAHPNLPNISDPNSRILKRQVYPENILLAYGPLIQGILSVPSGLSEEITKAGGEVPKPIEGFILIDTGASHTTVAEHVVKELGLHPVSTTITHGVHGENEVFQYFVSVTIPTDKNTFQMTEIVTSANIEKMFHSIEIILKKRIIGLLGRDFLRNVKLIVDISNNEIVLLDNDSRIKIM